ncbi:MAG: hypothetical protein N2C14_09420, partial [Planctomycetales bacterium]
MENRCYLNGISISDSSVMEGAGGNTLDFTISLESTEAQDVTVEVSTLDGTATAGADYVALTNQDVTITAGSLSQTVSVNIVGDGVPEDDESFTLVMSESLSAPLPAGVTLGSTLTTSPALAIPNPSTVMSQLNVTQNFTVSDLDVGVDITHLFDSQVSVALISPTGTRVELFG